MQSARSADITARPTDSDDDTLGGRIVEAREAAGLTTAELAARAGVTEETLSSWELDRDEPRSNRLSTLAGVLGVSPTWLLAGHGAAPRENGEARDALAVEVERLQTEAASLAARIGALGDRVRRTDRAGD